MSSNLTWVPFHPVYFNYMCEDCTHFVLPTSPSISFFIVSHLMLVEVVVAAVATWGTDVVISIC